MKIWVRAIKGCPTLVGTVRFAGRGYANVTPIQTGRNAAGNGDLATNNGMWLLLAGHEATVPRRVIGAKLFCIECNRLHEVDGPKIDRQELDDWCISMAGPAVKALEDAGVLDDDWEIP